MRTTKLRKRNNWENKHCGNFEIIFPSEEFRAEDYQKFIDSAKDVHEEFYNGGQAAKKRQEAEQKEEAIKTAAIANNRPGGVIGMQRPPSGTRRINSSSGSI